jgi:hypothetical protein
VLSHFIAVGLFSVQLTVAWVKQWNVFVTMDISVPLRLVQYFRFWIAVTIRVPGTCHNINLTTRRDENGSSELDKWSRSL